MHSVLVILMFCAVIAKTQSENGYNGKPYGPYMQGYTRTKRVKYSNPPQRFYSRPPSTFPVSGAFSYTPPPGYMLDNDEPSYPGNTFSGVPRPKVSKIPNTEGIKEEDFHNFVKYLSKQDLDKIVEYAEHNRDRERTREPYEKNTSYRPTTDEYNNIHDLKMYSKPNDDDNKIFKALVQEVDLDSKFNPYPQTKPRNEYQNSPTKIERIPLYTQIDDYQDTRFSNKDTVGLTQQPFFSDPPNHIYNNNLLNTQESAQSQYSNNPNSFIIESEVMPEEHLPRPVNLRESEDTDAAYTHNVPAVARPDPSYKVESFGELPLMDYNSKLDKLSSYHVPHYTVTSSASPNAEQASAYNPSTSYSSSLSYVAVEPAPPSSAAKEQSDAHLKAIKIWSHKSKGTAYTLHDDGTLSLEKPGRPGYGYS